DSAGKTPELHVRTLGEQPCADMDQDKTGGEEHRHHQNFADLLLHSGNCSRHQIRLWQSCGLRRRAAEHPVGYFCAVTRMTSLGCWSIVATPHAVAVPLALNLQPHMDPAGMPHWPLSMDATQKPDPTGRPRELPAPLTPTSSSPVPVVPLLHVNVPGE